MVVIDTTFLLLMLRPGTPVPNGADGLPIENPKERIEYLVSQLDKAKTKIIIPAPALGEALVRAGAEPTQKIVEHLQKYSVFSIEPFDTRAAIEVAAMSREALAKGRKKGKSDATWAKVKYDRQIVAIAKVHGTQTIYSDDSDIRTLGARAKISVVSLADLPLPPQKAQMELGLEENSADTAQIVGADIAEEQPSPGEP
jgi:hypothetical protein